MNKWVIYKGHGWRGRRWVVDCPMRPEVDNHWHSSCHNCRLCATWQEAMAWVDSYDPAQEIDG